MCKSDEILVNGHVVNQRVSESKFIYVFILTDPTVSIKHPCYKLLNI